MFKQQPTLTAKLLQDFYQATIQFFNFKYDRTITRTVLYSHFSALSRPSSHQSLELPTDQIPFYTGISHIWTTTVRLWQHHSQHEHACVFLSLMYMWMFTVRACTCVCACVHTWAFYSMLQHESRYKKNSKETVIYSFTRCFSSPTFNFILGS